MKKIIFVDKGNFFRSPIAKALYNHLSKTSDAESYGVVVKDQGRKGTMLKDYPELREMLGIMAAEGMDISKETCKQISMEALHDSPKIILLAESDAPEWLTNHEHEFWEITNPEVLTPKIIESVIAELTKKIKELL